LKSSCRAGTVGDVEVVDSPVELVVPALLGAARERRKSILVIYQINIEGHRSAYLDLQ
jgi:hypothetical protein